MPRGEEKRKGFCVLKEQGSPPTARRKTGKRACGEERTLACHCSGKGGGWKQAEWRFRTGKELRVFREGRKGGEAAVVSLKKGNEKIELGSLAWKRTSGLRLNDKREEREGGKKHRCVSLKGWTLAAKQQIHR